MWPSRSSRPSRNVSGRRPSLARHPSTTTCCSRRCLCLTHAALRRPVRYGASRRLNTTPSRPCALVTATSSAACSTKWAGTIQRPPSRSRSSSSERRARYGRLRVERPPTCKTSKFTRRLRCWAPSRALAEFMRARTAPKSGRPSALRQTISASTSAVCRRRRRPASATSSGNAELRSWPFRERSVVRRPSCRSCPRSPSHLTSAAQPGPSGTPALVASIGSRKRGSGSGRDRGMRPRAYAAPGAEVSAATAIEAFVDYPRLRLGLARRHGEQVPAHCQLVPRTLLLAGAGEPDLRLLRGAVCAVKQEVDGRRAAERVVTEGLDRAVLLGRVTREPVERIEVPVALGLPSRHVLRCHVLRRQALGEAARTVGLLLLVAAAPCGEGEGYHGGENAGDAATPQRESHVRELGKHESRKCQELEYDARAVAVQHQVQERLSPARRCTRQAHEHAAGGHELLLELSCDPRRDEGEAGEHDARLRLARGHAVAQRPEPGSDRDDVIRTGAERTRRQREPHCPSRVPEQAADGCGAITHMAPRRGGAREPLLRVRSPVRHQ